MSSHARRCLPAAASHSRFRAARYAATSPSTFAPANAGSSSDRNGAGKTTLLQTLAGLRPPAAGTVTLDGAPIASYAPRMRAQRLGFLPQDTFDAFPATALEIALGGRHPHVPRWRPESAADMAARARGARGGRHG